MSEAHDTDSTEGLEADQESETFSDLRKKNRSLEKQLKEANAKVAEAEERESTERAEAAKQTMNALGFPGLWEDVLGWIEGPITEQSAREALEAKSLTVNAEGAETQQSEPDEPTTQSASTVGQRVADAASGLDQRSVEQRIGQAETTEEVTAIMEELGAVTDQM